MLKGIEILSKTNIYSCASWMVVIMVIFIILSLILAFVYYNLFNENKYILCSLICIICFIVFFIISCCNQTSYLYTKYKVTISDEVKMTEFNEKYEILEQDGKIYTIKERKNNERYK